jgi:hypothetical protein
VQWNRGRAEGRETFDRVLGAIPVEHHYCRVGHALILGVAKGGMRIEAYSRLSGLPSIWLKVGKPIQGWKAGAPQ